MGPSAACVLNSSRSHPRVVSAGLTCLSDSASGNLRPLWLLRLLNGQFLCATPGRVNILFYFILKASILINEWVSLWDHCTVWGLGLHDSHKFLSHLRKPKPARGSLVTFLQSKALMYFPHFYPDKFYNGSQIEEKCQIRPLIHSAKTIKSPTTEQPSHPSAEPWVFLDFFHNWEPLPSTFPLGGQFPWHLSASLPPSIFWLSGNFSVSFNWALLSV